jgi:fructose-1,6-bisphosphatase/inositol monophosphatase family enzyme
MMTPDIDFDAVTTVIAEIAAEEVKGKLGILSRAEVSEKSAGDFVTTADLAVERRLGAALMDFLPDAQVVGEEAVGEGRASIVSLAEDHLSWVIDPIDGTGNFAAGYPLSAVILALVRKDEVLAGWIHDPYSDRTFVGSLGGGAWFAGNRLSVHTPDESRLLNGSIYGRSFRRSTGFQATWARGRGKMGAIFNARCVGHEHMSRLAGLSHFGGYSKLFPWDHAAGFLMHSEAGGVGKLITGAAYKPSNADIAGLLAPDEDIWNKIRDIITTPEAG